MNRETIVSQIIMPLAALSAIFAFWWDISGDIGELRGAVEANTRAISDLRDDTARDIDGLRDDVRELRGILTSHLTAHGAHNTVAVKTDISEKE